MEIHFSIVRKFISKLFSLNQFDYHFRAGMLELQLYIAICL